MNREKGLALVKATAFAMLPLMCCLVFCAVQGHGLTEVYLPSSELNDELFYYKQVECIIEYGYPQGYFGFNESCASKLSFAAWSPVLVIPWVIWGLIFGWNIMSPIICNIVLMSLACFLFVLLVRPNGKQLTILTLLFCLYTPFVRYMLSGMSETICFSTMIIFYSFALNYLRKRQHYKLIILFILSGIMTLMRPYLALFLLLPLCLGLCGTQDRTTKIKRSLGAFIFIAVILGLYVGINRYFSAAYFGPLFSTDWFSAFFEQGFMQGSYLTARKLYSNGKDFILYAAEGFRSGLPAGVLYAGHLICVFILLLQSVNVIRRNTFEQADKNKLVLDIHLILSNFIMIIAILLMYKLPEGGRHLAIFTTADIFVLSVLMEDRFYKKILVVFSAFAYLYPYMTHYPIPYVEDELVVLEKQWSETLSQQLVLDTEASPNYENVVIWVIGDMVDESPAVTSWQLLYALPAGFGINCCMYDYVADNFDNLKSRYIFVVQGGTIEDKCIRAGYTKLAEGGGMVLFSRS